jgi:hypothetical protein
MGCKIMCHEIVDHGRVASLMVRSLQTLFSGGVAHCDEGD